MLVTPAKPLTTEILHKKVALSIGFL